MSRVTEVVVPLENVNDESVTLMAWLVADGERVEEGQGLVEVETSKACVEIPAPATGYVRHLARVGQDVPIGAALARIAETAEALSGQQLAVSTQRLASPEPHSPQSWGVGGPTLNAQASTLNAQASTLNAQASALNAPTRFTPVAKKLIAEHGIDPSAFAGRGLVRQADVLQSLQAKQNGNGNGRPAPPPGPARFSAAARKLIEEHGLDPALFEGRGLVRQSDVLAFLKGGAETGKMPLPEAPNAQGSTPNAQRPTLNTPAAGVPRRNEPLPRRKRVEAKHLAAGVHNTLTSTVAVTCPTSGLRAAASRAESIEGNATAVIAFETARLLRRYPELNAFCEGDAISLYEEVNVGVAVDAGHGLKVPVIRSADRKTIAEIAAEMREHVVAYLGDELTPESLSGATFTISDLSGEGAFFFNPLISRGQAAILGVGAEFFLPGSREGLFNLILAFDHQLSEGRRAAQFLGELRDRLAGYEAALGGGAAAETETELCCSRCQRSFPEIQRTPGYLVPTMHPDGRTRLVCTLCLQGW
jgi:pyruvate/2-oxoglutarate dehydrogenase complex dihydrolipoamide acyltransferase (E2) component